MTLPTQALRTYEHKTDQISNFVVYSDSFFYWGNLDIESNGRSLKITNNDIDTSSAMVDLATSSNKLVVLYDGRLDYYRMTGTGFSGGMGPKPVVELLFSKTYTSSDIASDG